MISKYSKFNERGFRNPALRTTGPHIIRTEAETLDEALEIIKYQKKRKPKKWRSLHAEIVNKSNQYLKKISLSDRVVYKRRVSVPRKKSVAWSKEMVQEKYATGFFKIGELAKHAKVTSMQIRIWINEPGWIPDVWVCWACRREVVRPPVQGECPRCKTKFNEGLENA